MTGVTEVSFKQFIESVWFKGLARAAMMVTSLMVAGFFTAWAIVAGNTATGLKEAQAALSLVQTKQEARATDSEAFQTEVRAAVSDIQSDVLTVKLDLAEVKGILRQMQREQVSVAVPQTAPPVGNPMPLFAVAN